MVALVLLTALSVGLLSYRNIRSAILPRAAERIEVHVRVLAATLAAAVRGAREDAAGFREAAAIAGIVRAHLAGGTDPEDGLTEAAWRERLARRFAAELAAKPTYNIFRLIDFADGRELVRVDRLGENGAIRVVPDGQLEDHERTRFFQSSAYDAGRRDLCLAGSTQFGAAARRAHSGAAHRDHRRDARSSAVRHGGYQCRYAADPAGARGKSAARRAYLCRRQPRQLSGSSRPRPSSSPPTSASPNAGRTTSPLLPRRCNPTR